MRPRTAKVSEQEIALLLDWASYVDDERKLREEEVKLVERLSEAVGENPVEYMIFTRGDLEE